MFARRSTALAGAGVVLVCASIAGLPVAHAAAPVLPSADPFYTYSGTTPLASLAPGTVLNTRAVTIQLNAASLPVSNPTGLSSPVSTVPTAIPAEQLLYRTSDELGNPSATVTTVLVPAAKAATSAVTPPNIVAYLSFYDSLSPKCDPSYTLTGGDPDANNAELSDLEQGLVAQYYASGDVTTVPDFEGEGLHWTAGHEAGYATLDAIKATENYLKAPASSPVGLSGYSGGSIAADWASELAQTYAPSVNLVGVAEAGIPVDFAHNLTYINGSAVWSGIMPAVLDALARAKGMDLTPYLSDKGLALTKGDNDECIGDFSGTTPGLHIEDLLKPEYQNILQQPAFVDILNNLIMGTVPGAPKAPLFMGVGNDPNNAQGQGDDIMVTNDVVALAHEYCGQGVTVDYKEYPNSTHEEAALQFEPDASSFLAQRFAGAAAPNNCSSIGTGNSLAPIVLTPASTSSAAVKAAAVAKAAAAKKAAAKKAAAKKVTRGRVLANQPKGTLAFTGRGPAAGIAALALISAGALGLRRRNSAFRR